MSLILQIDTAVQTASVCLSKDTQIIGEKINPSQKDSASWLHVAIKDLLAETKYTAQQLNAVAVSAGPGSYTGLRVGMAAAKGFCYALQIPLITVNTLQQMAAAALPQESKVLLCPMIDARRMEVFTALYTPALTETAPPQNMILDEYSFAATLDRQPVVFFGNGSEKILQIIKHPNAIFANVLSTARHMAGLSILKFDNGSFADPAYAEPFYGKAFYTPIKKQ